MSQPALPLPPSRHPHAAPPPLALPSPGASRSRAPWKPIRDRAAVIAFGGLWMLACAQLVPALVESMRREPAFAAAALLGIAAGHLLADFVAGCVHWLADRHFAPDTPVPGPILIAPFRAHHEDPLSISRHDLFEVLGNNALVTLPVVAALSFAPPPGSALAVFSITLALAGSFAAVATNLFHAWAHAERPPRLARALQASGLILTPARHARHHRSAHDRAYCVTSGWLNPLLDGTRFFARLDERIAGIRPGRVRPRGRRHPVER